MLFYTK